MPAPHLQPQQPPPHRVVRHAREQADAALARRREQRLAVGRVARRREHARAREARRERADVRGAAAQQLLAAPALGVLAVWLSCSFACVSMCMGKRGERSGGGGGRPVVSAAAVTEGGVQGLALQAAQQQATMPNYTLNYTQ